MRKLRVMSPEERKQKIDALKPKQAISIVRTLTDKMRNKDQNYDLDDVDEVQALSSLYNENGHEIDEGYVKKCLSEADNNAAAMAASDLLKYIATQHDQDLIAKLDEQLDNPPNENTASLGFEFIPLIVTGCVALLNVTSGIKYSDGKWEYNPRDAIEVIKANVDGVVSILKSIIPFAKSK